MRFDAWPWVSLLALLPALGLLYAYGFRRRRQALAAFAEQGLAARLLPAGGPRAAWPSAFCLLGAVACLVIALMQPQWGQGGRTLPLLGRDVIVLLDVSYSMLAEDAQPNRLERAKAALRPLVEAVQRDGGHRLGLVTFAGRAEVLCPLTRDYRLFLKRLEDASADAATRRGTSIEAALVTVARGFGELAPGYTDLILLSDGEDHEGEPAEAAAALLAQGLRLDTVVVGDPDRSTPIPITIGAERGYLSRAGQEVRSRPQSALLTTLAQAAGGRSSALEDGVGLDRLYRERIAGAPRRELSSGASPELGARYQLFLLAAIVLLLLEQALRRSGRVLAPEAAKTRASLWLQPRPRLYVGLLALLPLLGSDQAARAVHEGNLLYGTGQYLAALEKYQTAAEALPESAVVRFNQGAALYKARDQEQALERFLAALAAAEPGLASRANYNLGVIKYRQALVAAHDYQDALPLTRAAIRYFRDSLGLDGRQDDARYNLELAYRLKARIERQEVSDRQNAQQPRKNAWLRRGQAFADMIRNQGSSQRQATPDRSHRQRNQRTGVPPSYFSPSSDEGGEPPKEAPLPAAMDADAAKELMSTLRERFEAAEIWRREQRRKELIESQEPMPW